MMKRVAVLTAALTLAATAALAQTAPVPEPAIVVTGSGRAERSPDFGSLTIELQGQGSTQVAALGQLEASRARATSGLESLTGATAVKIETGEISVATVRPSGCDAEENYDTPRPANCAPVAFQAELTVSATIYPAGRVGSAASLAAQLGAEEVRSDTWGVSNGVALRAEAARRAFEHARAQATLLASAAGRRLGPVIRVERSTDTGEVEEVVVTGSRIRRPPAQAVEVEVPLTPAPVIEAETVTVHFRLD